MKINKKNTELLFSIYLDRAYVHTFPLRDSEEYPAQEGAGRGHSRRLEGFRQATEASFRSVGSRRELFTMRFGGSTIGLRRLVPLPEVGSGEGIE